MVDVLWLVLPIVACVGMLWWANHIEPHWAARDGRRFLTTAQVIDRDGRNVDRRREVRVAVAEDDHLLVARRRMMRREQRETFHLVGAAPHPPRRKAVYLLDAVPPDGGGQQLVLRLPRSSRAVPVLDGILARRA